MKTISFFAILALILISRPSIAGYNKIKIEGPHGRTIVVSSNHNKSWELAENGKTWVLQEQDKGLIAFNSEGTTISRGKLKGDKLIMQTPSGNLFIKLKIKSDKIKIVWEQSGNEWEFIRKTDKVSVRFDGIDYGKIKFYPDTGKLKAKDRMGVVVAEAKNLTSLSSVPGALLIKDLPQDRMAFLILFLFSRGK